MRVGHQGLYHDPVTDLVYNRHRMLHTQLGRFTQRDPLGYVDGMSVYEYIESSPHISTDSFGLCKKNHVQFKIKSINDKPTVTLAVETVGGEIHDFEGLAGPDLDFGHSLSDFIGDLSERVLKKIIKEFIEDKVTKGVLRGRIKNLLPTSGATDLNLGSALIVGKYDTIKIRKRDCECCKWDGMLWWAECIKRKWGSPQSDNASDVRAELGSSSIGTGNSEVINPGGSINQAPINNTKRAFKEAADDAQKFSKSALARAIKRKKESENPRETWKWTPSKSW
jgi:RHS repeat-associated protein